MKKSYLIIDDDDTFRNKLAESFLHRNIEVHTAKNISNAKELLNKKKIHRIILDLKLNNENGLDLLNEHFCENYEIIVLTGYGSVSTVKKAFQKGVANYIQKPASLDHIMSSFEKNEEDKPFDANITLNEIERDHINRVIVEQNGNITKSAKILGLHRRSLQRKLNKES